MSFSYEVKQEITLVSEASEKCRLAQLCGILFMLGKLEETENGRMLSVCAENLFVIKNCVELLHKTFLEDCEIIAQRGSVRESYRIRIPFDEEMSQKLWYSEEKGFCFPTEKSNDRQKRAFLRGAFLAAGTVSDPIGSYHFEILCRSRKMAEKIQKLIASLEVVSRILERPRYFAVYVKESDAIVELLIMIGARKTLLAFENARIVREMRGKVNRKVNCETANISRTAKASAKQIEDILFIQETVGFASLPDGLDEIAKIRVKYPEATLDELGQMLDPPTGKSGANHRLRKLSQIAQKIRDKGSESQ